MKDLHVFIFVVHGKKEDTDFVFDKFHHGSDRGFQNRDFNSDEELVRVLKIFDLYEKVMETCCLVTHARIGSRRQHR